MKALTLVFFLCFFAAVSQAEQSKTVGDFSAHYSVFNSASLNVDVARQYGITRAGNQGVIMISVRRQRDNQNDAAAAQLSGSAHNLIGQKFDLTFKEIKESGAIYYVATFRFDDKDHLKFNVSVTPTNGDLITIDHLQQLFIEP